MKKVNGKKHRFLKVLLVLLAVLIVFSLGDTICNRCIRKSYDSLSSTDKELFKQISMITTEDGQIGSELWTDYDMTPTILVQKGNHLNFANDTFNLIRGNVYAIGVKGLENKWYAQKIDMPEKLHLPDVYRLSVLTPGIAGTWSPLGNFESAGQSISLGDSCHVYFFKYNRKLLENPDRPDDAFLSFWAHESFHYLLQTDWNEGESYIRPEDETGFLNLGVQYAALDELTYALEHGSDADLQTAVDDYVVASEACLSYDKSGFNKASLHETLEGCAQYAGVNAAELSGGELKLMPYKNEKQRSFVYYMKMMASTPGHLDEVCWNRYQSGVLLCQVLDKLNVKDWQKRLNSQNVTTLYQLIKEQSSANLPTYEQVQSKYDMSALQGYAKELAEQSKDS